ncbi:DUF3556 domain-containing protein [Mycolicibacterium sp. XJ1819]
MGFMTPDLTPNVVPEEFLRRPLMQRMRALAMDWAENGFGTARIVHVTYIAKLIFFFALGGIVIATVTSGLPAFWRVSEWWNQPIVYQKVILWVVLLEAVGLAGTWGPLAFKVKPKIYGVRFWVRPGTIRLRPWRWVPLTGGDRRTVVDVVLYLALLGSVVVALVSPGVSSASLSEALPDNTSGLVNPALLVAPIVLLVVTGLRDKTIFLAARGEQYLPALVFFAVLPFTDMIIALKILIVVVWVGAAFSKFGAHFPRTVAPMISNMPLAPKWFRRAQYRDFPQDLQPSKVAYLMSHGPGTVVEFGAPLVLLFSMNKWLTLVAVLAMVAFHLFIIQTFPLAVPLEWNVVFAYATVFLFLGFPAWQGYAVADMSTPWLTVGITAALFVFPVLGNLRPDKVSFLPAMRQYAGNWASALWALTPGAEAKLNRVTRPVTSMTDQFVAAGFDPQWAELTAQKTIAWRSMNCQARGLFSLLLKRLPDIDSRTVREGEVMCVSLIGFQFGDGHLHDERMIRAVQREANFAPGECVIAWVESQAVASKVQHYKLIDAAIGVIERGTWRVAEAAGEQPWLPNGPIATEVAWRRKGDQPNGPAPAPTEQAMAGAHEDNRKSGPA